MLWDYKYLWFVMLPGILTGLRAQMKLHSAFGNDGITFEKAGSPVATAGGFCGWRIHFAEKFEPVQPGC